MPPWRGDPRLAGRAGQTRAGQGGTSPDRYPAQQPVLPGVIPGSGIYMVPGEDPAGQLPPPDQVTAPWYEKPRLVTNFPWGSYHPMTLMFDAVTPAAGVSLAANATQEIVGFSIPSKSLGVLMWWGHECCDSAAWTSIEWTIRVNGSTVPNQLWTTQIAGITQDRLRTVYVPLGYSRVSLYARETAGSGPFTVFGCVKGYYFPEEMPH